LNESAKSIESNEYEGEISLDDIIEIILSADPLLYEYSY